MDLAEPHLSRIFPLNFSSRSFLEPQFSFFRDRLIWMLLFSRGRVVKEWWMFRGFRISCSSNFSRGIREYSSIILFHFSLHSFLACRITLAANFSWSCVTKLPFLRYLIAISLTFSSNTNILVLLKLSFQNRIPLERQKLRNVMNVGICRSNQNSQRISASTFQYCSLVCDFSACLWYRDRYGMFLSSQRDLAPAIKQTLEQNSIYSMQLLRLMLFFSNNRLKRYTPRAMVSMENSNLVVTLSRKLQIAQEQMNFQGKISNFFRDFCRDLRCLRLDVVESDQQRYVLQASISGCMYTPQILQFEWSLSWVHSISSMVRSPGI